MTDNVHERENLLLDAERVDRLRDPRFQEWAAIQVQIENGYRRLISARRLSRWAEEIEVQGSPEAALRQANIELADLNARLDHIGDVAESIAEAKSRLESALSGTITRMAKESTALAERSDLLTRKVAQAEARRKSAVDELVERGVPADVAASSAKPTLNDIAGMRHELDAIPAAREELERLLASDVAKVEHMFPAEAERA